MKPCRITVLKTMYNEEIAVKYRRPDIHRGSCPYLSAGQVFIVREPTVMPEDFPCGWAWNDIERMVFALMTGGDMGRWMIEGNTFVTCCTDGIKPVIFLLERIEDGGGREMIRLAPMTEEQYETFSQISARDQMEGHIREGRWKPEEAEANMARLTAQFLPDGLATPDHFFYALVEEDTGALAGGLWYMLAQEGETRQFFVVDIQVYDAFRRRGYGTQAFRAMEEHAREMGVPSIALHVFADNHPARAMYRKLGYVGTETAMAKQIA